VKHFHGWYQREHGGQRSYTWVKQALQAHGAVVRAKAAPPCATLAHCHKADISRAI